MTASLVGTWRLLSTEMEMVDSGERLQFFGARPNGRAILTEDGYMMALITGTDRSPSAEPAGMAALLTSMVAYSGAYRIEDGKLITKCDLAWQPGWVGTEQVRIISFEGDKLVLTSPPQAYPAVPGREVRGVLAWRREA
ncbi:MAG TPA: lipocalin-like domain-containing protein [Reyranella sp.]|nr:lipocalin-like domain-containing protein [Reyranella sp.]